MQRAPGAVGSFVQGCRPPSAILQGENQKTNTPPCSPPALHCLLVHSVGQPRWKPGGRGAPPSTQPIQAPTLGHTASRECTRAHHT